MTHRRLLAAAASIAALATAGNACADSLAFNAPNVVNVAGATSVTLNGATFVNQGLVGTARLPADLHDFNGETLGSFSGMAIDLNSWRKGPNGYTASMFTLPDRGPNNIGPFVTTDYAARLNRFDLTFNPYTGAASVASNNQQMQLVQSGGFLLKDSAGQVFTGRDPQSGVIVRNGISYPTPPAGDVGAGKIALDAEAVAFLNDGSFYIGDEYGAAMYYFDANGRQIGAIQAPPDLLPRVNGQVNFNGTNDSPLVAGSTGRRSNQGMEGVSVSPDGKRLFAVLQSATLQDNPTNVAARRNNTRVLVYDISGTRTPTTPMAEYVLQLPVYNNSATGTGAASTTAAQSEVLALNNTQFLVLSRDGNGRGTNGNANAIAFKSVLLVDVSGATNIASTNFSNTTPISTTAASNGSGALVGGIVPVQQVELVNMLNTAQLSKFGINTKTNPSVQYTLSEKWEAMGLAPVLEEGAPHDFFLLIGNDNDFVSHDIDAAGVTNANAALSSPTAGTGDNDNVIMVYRLTIPTYIDPKALAYLDQAGPIALSGARVIGAELGAASTLASRANLDSVRRARAAGLEVKGLRGWAQGAFDSVATTNGAGVVQAGGFATGLEGGVSNLRYGVALSGSGYKGHGDSPFDFNGHAYGASVYGGWFASNGFYLHAGVGGGSVKMKISRPGAYGQTAVGKTDGSAFNADVQIGRAYDLKGARITPFADVLYTQVRLDAYAEHGASVSNGLIPKSRYGRLEGSLGAEITAASAKRIRPSLRIAYTAVEVSGDRDGVFALVDLPNSAATVAFPNSAQSFASGQLALEGDWRGFTWRTAVAGRAHDSDTSMQVVFGFSKAF